MPRNMVAARELLTRAELADAWGLATQTLANWASNGSGPPMTKLGKGRRARVRYDRERAEEWLKRQQLEATK